MIEKLIQERKTALMQTLDDCSAFNGYQADTMRITYAIDKLIEAHLLAYIQSEAALSARRKLSETVNERQS